MAEINLLNQKSTSHANIGNLISSIVVKAVLAILLGVVVYYGYLFYKIKTTEATIIQMQNKIKDNQEKIKNFDKRDEIITRQGQLKELKELYKNHLYWSKLIPELSRVTLRTASYLNFSATADGKVTLAAVVPDYASLDKFLSVFDLPEFNRCINDVKLLNISKSQRADTLETKFDLQLKYNPELIHQQPTVVASSTVANNVCR